MKVTNLLNGDAKQILTQESLEAIETAFAHKLNITVESALAQQDDLYARKLKQLVTAIDKDHAVKLKRVVEAIDKNNTGKLIKVVKRYDKELNADARVFKTTLIESISNYLEEFIDEAIPTQAIAEATKNRTAMDVLSNLRKVLAIDSALMKESVQDAVIDGKKQIETLAGRVDQLEKENTVLKENYRKTKASLLLETKTSSLTPKKKEYIMRVLADKSPKFIEENFDYTLRLFEKKEKERIDMIKDEAFETRRVKADAPIIRESTQQKVKQKEENPYVTELERYK